MEEKKTILVVCGASVYRDHASTFERLMKERPEIEVRESEFVLDRQIHLMGIEDSEAIFNKQYLDQTEKISTELLFEAAGFYNDPFEYEIVEAKMFLPPKERKIYKNKGLKVNPWDRKSF
jgi:aminopeptidase C